MPQDIEIKIENVYNQNDLYTKLANIKIGSGNFIPLYPAANPKGVRSNTLKLIKVPIPLENYVKITLDKLREMDSDKQKQSDFITEKFVMHPGSICFFVTKLLVKESQKITDKDIDYLVDLLNFHSNDIMVPPLVYHYYNTKPSPRFKSGLDQPTIGIDTGSYLSFLKTFLEKSKQRNINSFALTLPNNFPHDKLDDLLNVYKDYDTKIVLIDAKGGKAAMMEPNISKITSSKEKGYTLPQKNGEKFVLYSFDCLPFTAHRQELAPGENVLQYLSAFNSFGPRHTVHIVSNDGPEHPPRLYKEEELSYVRHDSKSYAGEKNDLSAWVTKNYGKVSDIFAFKRDYEVARLSSTVDKMYKNIQNTSFWQGILKKPSLSDVLKRIQSTNKKYPNV